MTRKLQPKAAIPVGLNQALAKLLGKDNGIHVPGIYQFSGLASIRVEAVLSRDNDSEFFPAISREQLIKIALEEAGINPMHMLSLLARVMEQADKMARERAPSRRSGALRVHGQAEIVSFV